MPLRLGKKYKACCMQKEKSTGSRKKFTAKLLSQPKAVNLIERTFGQAIEAASRDEKKQGEAPRPFTASDKPPQKF